MKHLFILLIFISVKNGLSAQVTDSTNTNNPPRMDSTNNMNNNSMNADTTHAMNNMNNNSTNNMNNNSMNNMSNMNSNGMGSMSRATAFAALPVKESYISDDILSKIKSKYGNGSVIYDITAIRAATPKDSSMTQQNGMSTDSSMTKASNNGDSTMAPNGNMMQNSSMVMPIKYNYMVRTISNGTLQSEWLGDDGTTSVTPGEMNK